MATFKMTYLVCDECDEAEFDGAERLASVLRYQAKAAGWTVNLTGGGRDVCPDCQAKATARHRVTFDD